MNSPPIITQAMRIAVVFLLMAALAMAGSPAIGIVTASGSFTLNNSAVYGNATLFDGAKVETGAASSEIALNNGMKLLLAAQSSARVFSNKVVLEKGAGQLWIKPQLAMWLGPGTTSLDEPQAGQFLTLAGCLVMKSGHYLLLNDADNALYELLGTSVLDPQIGNHVQVKGTAQPVSSTIQGVKAVVNASDVSVKEQGGCLAVAARLGASANPPEGAATTPSTPQPTTPTSGGGGLSKGAKIGIAVAAAGGGAGAAIALASKKSSTSR